MVRYILLKTYNMNRILKKLIIATITLFSALLITILVTKTNLLKQNFKEVVIYYSVYIVIYLGILLLNKKVKGKSHN